MSAVPAATATKMYAWLWSCGLCKSGCAQDYSSYEPTFLFRPLRNRVKGVKLNNNHEEIIPRGYRTRASMMLCIYLQKYLPVFVSWNQVIFENQIWKAECYWWCFCDICIAVCLSGFQWDCSSAWGWASCCIPDLYPLGFSWLIPFGVFLTQRHTKVHPGAISKIITYNFPSLWVL